MTVEDLIHRHMLGDAEATAARELEARVERLARELPGDRLGELFAELFELDTAAQSASLPPAFLRDLSGYLIAVAYGAAEGKLAIIDLGETVH